MTTNAIAISRRLMEAGVAQKVAESIVEEMATHSDANLATKADIAHLEGKMEMMFMLIKINMGLAIGLYVGLAVLFCR